MVVLPLKVLSLSYKQALQLFWQYTHHFWIFGFVNDLVHGDKLEMALFMACAGPNRIFVAVPLTPQGRTAFYVVED